MLHRRLICFLTALFMAVLCCTSASALQSTTLREGSKGESVRSLQQALIDLGFLNGKADGIFGKQTRAAVCSYQRSRKLKEDGLAGKKTLAMIQEDLAKKSNTSSAASSSSSSSSSSSASSSSSSSSSSSGKLFSGNYATIRLGDRNDRVKILQQALIRLKYLSGKADGIFGQKTLDAVVLFQKENKLSADGLAGKKTLTALETADRNNAVRGSSSASSTSASSESSSASSSSSSSSSSTSSSSASSGRTAKAPDGSTLRLLHWFNDIKPSLKNGEKLLIYDPSTGLSWTLKVLSRGRHCDCEPLTLQDTKTMEEAFGFRNTWDQKGVYVKLPSGVWTIGSTHDMPHLSGSSKDNGFDGHLCVHFLRDMEETEKNDPSYGVANQNTIRALWKSLTGEVISK